MAIKYFCDRCKKEVAEGHLATVTIKLSRKINSTLPTMKGLTQADVCAVCVRSIHKVMTTAPPEST